MKLNFTITRRFSIDINDIGDKYIELDTREFLSSNEIIKKSCISLGKENGKRYVKLDGRMTRFLNKLYPFKLKDEIRLLVRDTKKFREFDEFYKLQVENDKVHIKTKELIDPYIEDENPINHFLRKSR